jgi:Right handed beta helix region
VSEKKDYWTLAAPYPRRLQTREVSHVVQGLGAVEGLNDTQRGSLLLGHLGGLLCFDRQRQPHCGPKNVATVVCDEATLNGGAMAMPANLAGNNTRTDATLAGGPKAIGEAIRLLAVLRWLRLRLAWAWARRLARLKELSRYAHIVIPLCALLLPVATHAQVTLNPGDNVQAIVNAHPAGTTYVFSPGLYRMQSISPKAGDTYIGQPGAVLNGSGLLSGWQPSGATWVVGGQTQQGQVHGVCIASRPRCGHPEDVFVDGLPLIHVASLAQVDASSYFFDYAADRIYIGQDPAGKIIEVSTTRTAFRPTADNVTVRGFIIEKYAIPNQMGAIGDQVPRPGWLIESNEIRWNHGTGVTVGSNTILRNNNIHHNGQQGFAGGEFGAGLGTGIVIEGNEIAHNLWNGTDRGWEGGGSKMSLTNGLIVRNNYAHHNAGRALWTDIDNINALYEYNTVTDNLSDGIAHEISYDAIIRNNITVRNGLNNTVWLWSANISIQNSQNVEVHNNYVAIETVGDGISVIEQDRGSGAFGPYLSKNVNIHDNNIVYHVINDNMSGAVEDTGNTQFFTSAWNIRFDRNRYHATSLTRQVLEWQGRKTLTQAWASGQEVGGTIDTNLISAPQPIVSLSATPNTISAGQQSTLAFDGLLAKHCTAPWKLGRWVSGSVVVAPTVTTTYTLSCEGEGGTVNRSVTVTVGGAPPPPPPPPGMIRVVPSPTPPQSVPLSANPTSIVQGNSSTLTWSSTNATSCTGTNFTPTGTAGSVQVSPSVTTTYLLTCTGAGGTAMSGTTVTVTTPTLGIAPDRRRGRDRFSHRMAGRDVN